jgi:hypothetical protein
VPGVYAIGDVKGDPLVASLASGDDGTPQHHGVQCRYPQAASAEHGK